MSRRDRTREIAEDFLLGTATRVRRLARIALSQRTRRRWTLMAINRRKKKAAETNEDNNANISVKTPEDSTRPDTSDLTWLQFDTLPTVNDPALHARCIPVLEALKEHDLGLGEFVWAVNWGNEASRNDKLMQTARKDFRGEYLIPT